MQYYIETIEQIIKDNTLAEYGATEKVATENLGTSKYFKKLSDVSADIGNNHTFMFIKLVDSSGNILRQDFVGQYKENLLDEIQSVE